MKEILIDIIAWIGFVTSLITLLPQTIKVLIQKNTKSLSKITLFFLFLNSFVWIIYGVLTNQIQVYISSLFSLLFSFAIIVIVILNKIKSNKKEESRDIMHKLINLDEDLRKCENCSFTIQKIDDEWFTINTGYKNCDK